MNHGTTAPWQLLVLSSLALTSCFRGTLSFISSFFASYVCYTYSAMVGMSRPVLGYPEFNGLVAKSGRSLQLWT